MIATARGYKVTINNPIRDTIEGYKAVDGFFRDMRTEGFWYAVTGKHFGQWVADTTISFIQWLVNISDILMLGGILALLLVMFGSKRAQKWLYWQVCIYIVFQIVGLMV